MNEHLPHYADKDVFDYEDFWCDQDWWPIPLTPDEAAPAPPVQNVRAECPF